MLKKRRNPLINDGHSESLLSIKSIEFGLIQREDDTWIKILEIAPQGFSSMKNIDKNRVISSYLMSFCRNSPKKMHFKIVVENTDINSIVKPLKKRERASDNRMLKIAYQDLISHIGQMGEREAVSKKYYLILEYTGNVYTGKKSKNPETIAMDMEEEIRNIDNALRECGNRVIYHDNEEEFLENTFYSLLNKKSKHDENVLERNQRISSDIVKYNFSHEKNIEQEAIPFNTLVAPRGIAPYTDFVVIDGVYHSYLMIREDSFPTSGVPAGWVTNPAFLSHGCDMDIYFVERDADKTIDEIGLFSNMTKAALNTSNKQTRNRENTLEALESGEWIVSAISQGEKIYDMMMVLTVWAYSYEELQTKRGRVLNQLKKYQFKADIAFCNNIEAFKQSLPMCNINEKMLAKYKRNITSQGVASCYPFDEQRLSDHKGLPIGVMGSGSLAVFNPFDTQRYSNANIGIFGSSGSGKTFFTCMLTRRLALQEVGIIFMLPVKGYEYKYHVESLGGTYIDFSAGSNICINILEILPQESMDAQKMADMEITSKSLLQQKINEVCAFIEMHFERQPITDEEQPELESAIFAMYKEFGITNDNNSLYDSEGNIKQMPILSDLKKYIDGNEKLSRFSSIFKRYIEGKASNLNGQTNVDLSKKVIAFDVSNNDKNDLPRFLFLALMRGYNKVKENQTDRYALVSDETWKAMSSPASAALIDEAIRIVRGYASSFILATQNLGDLEKNDYGQSMINNMTTKFLLKMGDNEESIYKRMFHLTDEQILRIGKQRKGTLSMFSNKENYTIYTSASRLEADIYETDANKIKERNMRLKELGLFEKAVG